MSGKLRQLFSIDLRSLGLLRVCLGVFGLVDLVRRAPNIEAFYTDFGILPRSELASMGDMHRWSLHELGGGLGLQILLFVIAGVVSVAVAAGFKTRVATVALWILTVSVHARNPNLEIGGDQAFRIFLFWSMFLPLGARFSIDAIQKRLPRPIDPTICDAATVVLLLQILVIYPATAIHKWDHEHWKDLSMMSRIAVVDGITSPLGRLMRLVPDPALEVLTLASIAFEAVGAFFAFSPVATGRVRTFTVFAFWLFHASIGALMTLGLFPFIMITVWTPMLPPYFWDELLPRAIGWSRAKISILDRLGVALGEGRSWLVERLGQPSGSMQAASLGPSASTRRALHLGAMTAAGACFVLVLMKLGSVMPKRIRTPMPEVLDQAIRLVALEQSWALYTVVMSDRHYVYAAHLADGTSVDLHRNGAPLDWSNSREKSENNQWWKYQLHLSQEPEQAGPLLGAYLARAWDRDHPDRLVVGLDLVMSERLYEAPRDSTRRLVLLWHQDFFDGAPAGPQTGRRTRVRWLRTEEREGRRYVRGWFSTTGVACGADAIVDGRGCAFSGAVAPREGEGDPLLPFVDVDGLPFIATLPHDEATHPGADHRLLRCALTVHGAVDRPRLRFAANGPWFETILRFPTGALSDCHPANR